MQNKIGFLLILLFSGLFTSAQSYYDSPYNRYGIGDIVFHKNSQNLSMGGLYSANRSSLLINYENPASYSVFDSLSFVFNVGTITNSVKTTSINATHIANSVSLSQMLLGFPVTRWWAASIGFVPYSNVNYDNSESETVSSVGEVKYRYWGNGGTNLFYVGSSFSPLKSLAIGVNAGYLFGMITQYRTITFPESQNYFNLLNKNSYNIQDIKINYGIQYGILFNRINSLILGATFSNKSSLGTENEMQSFRYTGSFSIKDTLDYSLVQGNIVVPTSYSLGVCFSNGEKLLAGADFSMDNWSEYRSFGKPDSMINAYQLSCGVKYIPDIMAAKGYFKRIQYRAGFRYAKTGLRINNSDINEFGISFGMLLPLRRLATTINLGMEYGQRGSMENGLVKEDFWRIYVGLNIYERWFIKKKYY